MRARVYVAGPFSADNVLDVLQNMRDGICCATHLFELGLAPFCPWLDYHYILSGCKTSGKDPFYETSLAWLEVADAVYVIGNYEKSAGTMMEIKIATERGIPIFYTLSKLLEWAGDRP
jgi:nucleoside 2-deoxyribosyltransferase